jgi:hypothetical protein
MQNNYLSNAENCTARSLANNLVKRLWTHYNDKYRCYLEKDDSIFAYVFV